LLGGLERIMAGQITHIDNRMLRTLKRIGSRFSGATLAGAYGPLMLNRIGGYSNAATWLKQYSADTQEKRDQIAMDFLLIAGKPQIGQDKIVQKLMENGYLSNRWLGKAIRLALGDGEYNPSDYRVMREIEKVTEWLNKGMMRAERANSVAMYRAMTKNGIAPEAAIDAVEQMNRDTQNSTSEMDKSERASNIQQAFSAWFPFISQGFVQWDFAKDTWAQAKREGWKRNDPRLISANMTFLWNSVMLGAVVQLLTRMMRGEDNDELRTVADMLMAPVEQINPLFKLVDPIIGKIIGKLTGKNYAARPNNILEATLQDLGSATLEIATGNGDYKDYLKEASAIFKLVGAPAGLITTFRTMTQRMMPETKSDQIRREKSWFDDKAKTLRRNMSSLSDVSLRAQTDLLFNEAVDKGYVTESYSKAAFSARLASRFKDRGGVIFKVEE
jgi:hypothetical protein